MAHPENVSRFTCSGCKGNIKKNLYTQSEYSCQSYFFQLKHSSPVMVANLKKLPDKNLLSKNSPAKADERKVHQ